MCVSRTLDDFVLLKFWELIWAQDLCDKNLPAAEADVVVHKEFHSFLEYLENADATTGNEALNEIFSCIF